MGSIRAGTSRSILSEKMSPLDVVKYTLQLKEEVQMSIVTFMWLWWQERNRVREGERRRSVDELAFLCKQYAAEYLDMCKSNSAPTGGNKAAWKRPDPGWVKVNSDGAFSETTGEGGWGAVIRDEEGEVVEAAAGKLTRLMGAFQSEVEACLAGVMLARERGCARIMV